MGFGFGFCCCGCNYLTDHFDREDVGDGWSGRLKKRFCR